MVRVGRERRDGGGDGCVEAFRVRREVEKGRR